MGKAISSWLLAIFFVAAGINHFLSPKFYLSIMPVYLPWHPELVFISGVAEILGGIGVILPQTRRLAGWGLIFLLLAVFPANIHVALHGLGGSALPVWFLWARLPLQFVLIWWVCWTCLGRKAPVPPLQGSLDSGPRDS